MKAEELMDKYPLTITADTTVGEATRFFVKHGVSALPVVDDLGHLIGIISEADLLYKKVRPHVPHYVNILGASIFYGGMGEYNESFQKLLATSVEELMVYDVCYCEAEDDIETVATIMVEKHLKVVPIVKEKRVVGTVSRHDILRLMAEEDWAKGL